jgi:type IV pilus assembly protein PilM
MWNDKVTLYIEDTSLRLLVTNGQRIRKWAETHLEPGLVKDAIVLQENEVGARIKSLLKSQKVRTSKIYLVVSGLHSLTRPANLPLLPKSMLPEAVAREARRVLPVPLDQLYLSWRVLPGPKTRISVYLAATPRKSIDSFMKALKIAGVDATRMSIKPLVLTKAIPVNTAILIDLQPTEFDIAIMVDGVSQPVRTVSLPSEELSCEQKIKMIVSDLERTIKFYSTNNQDKPLENRVPIYIAGDLLSQPQYQKTLEESTGRVVLALSPVFKGLEHLDSSRFSTNIAMVLAAPAAGREMTFPVANLNLLPAQYLPKPLSLIKVVGIPGGIAVACALIPMIMMMQSTSANISLMKDQLNNANQVINQKTVQRQQIKKEIGELDKKSAANQKEVANLQKSLSVIRNSQDLINGDLLISLSKLNSKIELKSIRETADKMDITGIAYTSDDIQNYADIILTYARDLDISQRFSESLISSISIVSPSEIAGEYSGATYINFTLTFTREKK